MRKIDEMMVDAVKARQFRKIDNTTVRFVEENPRDVTVLLHGNRIADVRFDVQLKEVIAITLYDGGWQTRTTKSRLNALLGAFGFCKVSQKKGVWFIGVHPFESGCLVRQGVAPDNQNTVVVYK